MFKEFTGADISFFDLSKYLLPVAWVMVFAIWLMLMLVFRFERTTVPGLRERVTQLRRELGPVTPNERIVLWTVLCVVLVMALRSFLPGLGSFDRTSIMLIATLVFFASKILTTKDLEDVPWNIILLFSGAMSLGVCLWKTGAAQWIAVKWIGMFQHSHWLVFVLGVAALVLAMTNFIMNVAAIAISLPVSLVIAQYLGISPELVLYASLVTAGMPFFLLIGAAPNAMAYESKQFTAGEFFATGMPASVLLLAVLTLALTVLWPLLGMPRFITP